MVIKDGFSRLLFLDGLGIKWVFMGIENLVNLNFLKKDGYRINSVSFKKKPRIHQFVNCNLLIKEKLFFNYLVTLS